MSESYSQAFQDLFVLIVCNKKQNGFFIEIGTNDAIKNNNTYLLEKNYKWKGLLVEYDKSFEKSYIDKRKRSIYVIKDARDVDYKYILTKYEFPKNIDYLQIDLDVNNKSTIETLEFLNDTIFDEYKFATITFEHDIYSGDFFDTRKRSRKIFENRGYILVFPDVKVFWENEYKPFEDWYIHPDIVDIKIINKLKTIESLNCEEIKEKLLLMNYIL
jgi:hypothetical protein